MQFQCYAIALPAGVGIAVAAAFGLAEVGIVGVIIFVKVTEGVFNKIEIEMPVSQDQQYYHTKCGNPGPSKPTASLQLL